MSLKPLKNRGFQAHINCLKNELFYNANDFSACICYSLVMFGELLRNYVLIQVGRVF